MRDHVEIYLALQQQQDEQLLLFYLLMLALVVAAYLGLLDVLIARVEQALSALFPQSHRKISVEDVRQLFRRFFH